MTRALFIRATLAISSAALALGLFGCWHNNYRIELWDGYKVVKSNSTERSIVDSADIVVVDGNVLRLGLHRPWIVGERAAPSGFFLINTETGSVSTVDSPQQLQDLLAAAGVAGLQVNTPVHRLMVVPQSQTSE